MSIKSFGQVPYLNFNSLCCRNKNVIYAKDKQCYLDVKNATFRNLNVNNVRVDGQVIGNEKLDIESDLLINGTIFTQQDEHIRFDRVLASVGNVTIVPLEGPYDLTTVEIINEPCEGNIILDNLSGNILYEPIGNAIGQVDSFQYSINDTCGLKHIITQYVCRPSTTIHPFMNPCCVNGCFGEIDFRSWDEEQFWPTSNIMAAPNEPLVWTVWTANAETGAFVSQTGSQIAQQGIFYSDFDFGSCQIIEIPVRPTGDDDYIGFILGWQPGFSTNIDAEYLLIDWKAGDQFFDFPTPDSLCSPPVTAFTGLALSRVFGTPNRNELWGHLDLDSTGCSPEPSGVIELTRGMTLGSTPWVSTQTYIFKIEYSSNHLKVWVDDVLQFDETGTFPQGRIGAYCFSQYGDFGNFLNNGPTCIVGKRPVSWADTHLPFGNFTFGVPVPVSLGAQGTNSTTCEFLTTTTGSLVGTVYEGFYELLTAYDKSVSGLDWTYLKYFQVASPSSDVTIVFSNFNVGSNHKKGYFYNEGFTINTNQITIMTNPPNLQQNWTVVGGWFPNMEFANNQEAVTWNNMSGTLNWGGGNPSLHTGAIILDVGDLSQYTSITVTYSTSAELDGVRFSIGEEIKYPYDLCCDVSNGIIGGDRPVDFSALSVTRIEMPINDPEICQVPFTGWMQYTNMGTNPIAAVWTISNGNSRIEQRTNAVECYLVSPDIDLCEYNVQIKVTSVVITAGPIQDIGNMDDDIFGFTIGYNIGDETNPNADYLVISWAGGGAGFTPIIPLPNGISILRQQGLPIYNFYGYTMFNTVLTGSLPNWVFGESHMFRIEYRSNILNVYVDNSLIFELPWIFPNGAKFGLLTISQTARFEQCVKWTNVTCPCTALIPDEEWIEINGNIATAITNDGILTVSSNTTPKAIRVGTTIEDVDGRISNESISYFGFKAFSQRLTVWGNYATDFPALTAGPTLSGSVTNYTGFSNFMTTFSSQTVFAGTTGSEGFASTSRFGLQYCHFSFFNLQTRVPQNRTITFNTFNIDPKHIRGIMVIGDLQLSTTITFTTVPGSLVSNIKEIGQVTSNGDGPVVWSPPILTSTANYGHTIFLDLGDLRLYTSIVLSFFAGGDFITFSLGEEVLI